jgi:hypothetical protein
MAKGKTQKPANGSNPDFEAQLWAVADKMRGCPQQCVVQVLVAMLEPYKGRVFETLQSANANCSNRRMNRRGIQTDQFLLNYGIPI